MMHASIAVAVLMATHAPVTGPDSAAALPASERRGAHASVTWVYQPGSLREMVRLADTVVVARFVGTDSGPTTFTSSEDVFTTRELNRFEVEHPLKGAERSQVVTVSRISSYGLVGGEPFSVLGPDGPYELGYDYLLFLKRAPGLDVYSIVNDEARYSIGEDERVRPHGERAAATNGRVSRAVRGRRLPDVLRLVQAAID